MENENPDRSGEILPMPSHSDVRAQSWQLIVNSNTLREQAQATLDESSKIIARSQELLRIVEERKNRKQP
jgi:hypothetical protein